MSAKSQQQVIKQLIDLTIARHYGCDCADLSVCEVDVALHMGFLYWAIELSAQREPAKFDALYGKLDKGEWLRLAHADRDNMLATVPYRHCEHCQTVNYYPDPEDSDLFHSCGKCHKEMKAVAKIFHKGKLVDYRKGI